MPAVAHGEVGRGEDGPVEAHDDFHVLRPQQVQVSRPERNAPSTLPLEQELFFVAAGAEQDGLTRRGSIAARQEPQTFRRSGRIDRPWIARARLDQQVDDLGLLRTDCHRKCLIRVRRVQATTTDDGAHGIEVSCPKQVAERPSVGSRPLLDKEANDRRARFGFVDVAPRPCGHFQRRHAPLQILNARVGATFEQQLHQRDLRAVRCHIERCDPRRRPNSALTFTP